MPTHHDDSSPSESTMPTQHETLTSYLPALILRRYAANPAPIRAPELDRFTAAVLFADISGFTRLTERLAQRGPAGAEQLTALLNAYFEQLVTHITDHGGDVVKFAGDALLAVWSTAALHEDLATLTLRAAQCGLSVQSALQNHQAAEGVTLSLKVGIGAGELIALHLGGAFDRWELLLSGEPLEQVGVAEHQARPGDVVLSPAAGTLLGAACRSVPVEHGCTRLEAISRPLPPRPAVLPVTDGAATTALHAYLPGAIRARLDAGQAGWLAELRRVTVLFINLPGLNRSAADSLEATQRIVRGLQTALYRYEGSLNKLSVDEKGVTLVAALGLPPLTHEDDATRGVLAALAMQAELRSQGVRGAIGVTTGRVYCGEIGSVRRREYTIMGDTVNLAARLMQAAPDDLLCDAATYQAARGRLQFEALPPLTVKGKAEPVAAYRPLGRAAASGTAGALFGRSAERAILAEELAAIETGKSGVVVIEGEAGIGKSRLLSDLVEQSRSRGVTVLLGAGDAIEKTTPYHAWRSVFARLLGVDGLTEPQARREQVLRVLQPEPALLRLTPLLNGVLPLDIPDDELTAQMTGQIRADNTHELLLGLLQGAVRQAPTVLIVEDAHWLDSASWALTALIAQRVQPLLLVVATRPLAEPVPTEYTRLLETRGVRELTLEALPREDVLALVCQRLGVDALPEPVAELIQRKAQGHPFFSEELAYALRDSGLLRIADGKCHLTDAQGRPSLEVAMDFPDNVKGVITSRLDRLSPAQQLALKVASVIGRVFAFRVLHDIFPLQTERERLADHLTALERLNLTPLETPDPNLAYLFKHVLTQEAAYGLMLFAQRRELHRIVAVWYERTYAKDPTPYYPLLAHHWGKAEEPAKTIEYLEKAGEHALREGAYSEALTSLQEAVRLNEETAAQGRPLDSPLRQARWHREMGYACLGLGQVEDGRRNLEHAVQLLGYPMPSSRWRLVPNMLWQVVLQTLHRVFPSVIEGHAGTVNNPILEAASAYCGLVEIYYWTGEPGLNIFASLRALNLSEQVGLSPELARSLATVGFAATLIPLHSLAAVYCRRALQTARVVGDRAALAFVFLCNACYSTLAGHWEDVKKEIGEGIKAADTIGDRRLGVELTIVLSTALRFQADFQTAIQFARDCHSRASSSGDRQGQILGLLNEIECMITRGQLGQALMLLERTAPLLGRKHGAEFEFWEAGLRAVVLFRRGDVVKARALADIASNLIKGIRPTQWGPVEAYAGVAEVYLTLWEAGNATPEKCRQLKVDALRACTALWRYATIFQLGRPRAGLMQGLADWLSARPRRAHKAWRRSLADAVRLRMPCEEGLAHYEIGRHLPSGDAPRRTHLSHACDIFARIGAEYYLALARAAMES